MPFADGDSREPDNKKRRTRWGDVPGGDTNSSTAAVRVTSGNAGGSSPSPSGPTVPLSKEAVLARVAAAREALSRAGLGFSAAPAGRQQNVSNLLEGLKGKLPFGLSGESPNKPPTQFDPLGRPLDDEGNLIPIVRPKYATLKINKNLEKEAKMKQVYKVSKINLKAFSDPAQNPWYDPSLQSGGSKLKKQGLRFVESGFYLRRQQTLERRSKGSSGALDSLNLSGVTGLTTALDDTALKARTAADQFVRRAEGRAAQRGRTDRGIFLSAVARDAADAAEHDEAEDMTYNRQLVPLQRKRQDAFPELEAWDLALVERLPAAELASRKSTKKWKKGDRGTGWSEALPSSASEGNQSLRLAIPPELPEDNFPFRVVESQISHLVEHPVPIEPIAERDFSQIAPVIYLTEQERRKMRRRKRKAKEQEKQDKIRMGLIPPDPPKTKLSNLMRVLGEEAVAGPTGTELKVRKQVRDRLANHEARNAAKKLSDERRAEKTAAKWMQKDETSVVVSCAVFALKDITEKKILYKIHTNAKQLHVTGVCVICPGTGNLVVVEGGPRAVGKYKALMLRRIKWTPDMKREDEGEDDDQTLSLDKQCKLVWEGTVKERVFKTWKMVNCSTEAEVERHMNDLHGEMYWAMLTRYRDSLLDVL